MNNFCYWQESPPTLANFMFLQNMQKICLFRQAEYQLDGKTNIFCPYSAEQAKQECKEYIVTEEQNGEVS